jgi:predicted RNA binding protein YcfA (HicA-like mRNA interferase family)
MRLPRGVSTDRVIRALERLGYEVIRQKGSHAQKRSVTIESIADFL